MIREKGEEEKRETGKRKLKTKRGTGSHPFPSFPISLSPVILMPVQGYRRLSVAEPAWAVSVWSFSTAADFRRYRNQKPRDFHQAASPPRSAESQLRPATRAPAGTRPVESLCRDFLR